MQGYDLLDWWNGNGAAEVFARLGSALQWRNPLELDPSLKSVPLVMMRKPAALFAEQLPNCMNPAGFALGPHVAQRMVRSAE